MQTYTETGGILSANMKMNVKHPDGIYHGFKDVGNVSISEITPESDTKTRESFRKGTRGQSLSTRSTAKPTKIKIEGDTMTFENIAMAVAATLVTGGVQAAGSVTDEDHIAYKGYQIRLKKDKPTNIVLSKGATLLAENTDYVIDEYDAHFIKILETSLVVSDGDTITADYDHGATSYVSLLGGLASFDVIIELNGLNEETGREFTQYIGNATITPNGAFGLIGSDYTKFALEGIANIDTNPESPCYGHPYVIHWDKVAA